MYDLIIIGGGVSGLSASIYASSRGLKTLVIEKNKVGGLVNEISIVSHYLGVENNENGIDFVNRVYNQAKLYNNTEFKIEQALSIDFENKIVKTNVSSYQSKAIIIATGTDKKEFYIKDIEKYLQKNVFYVVNENVDKIKNKNVVVLGSGDGAFKEAIFLSKFAKKVYILTKDKEPKVILEFREKIANIKNIQILSASQIKELKGDEKLESIVVEKEETKELFEIKDDEVFLFIFIGRIPNVQFLEKIKLENSAIKANSDLSTNIKGIFASGDVVNKSIRQISTAVSDGTIAAVNAFKYIKSL